MCWVLLYDKCSLYAGDYEIPCRPPRPALEQRQVPSVPRLRGMAPQPTIYSDGLATAEPGWSIWVDNEG